MSLPATVTHTGSFGASPSQGSIGIPSLQELLNTSFSATYSATTSARPTISSTSQSPFAVPLVTITKVRAIAMQVRSGSLEIQLTSAAGTDQAFRCSSLFMLHVPNSGDEVTAIKLIGTADVEYALAGDVS